MTAWGGLVSILLAEHFYLLAQQVVRFVMNKVESPGLQQERKERFMTKKKLLAENLGQEATAKAAVPGVVAGEKITKEALEEQARQASMQGGHGSCEEL